MHQMIAGEEGRAFRLFHQFHLHVSSFHSRSISPKTLSKMPSAGRAFLLPLLLALLPFLPGPVFSSYCGQSAIPFSLEIRPDGQPVLGCARPACFGWRPDGRRAADAAQFYRIWGRADGFVRVADLEREKKGNRSLAGLEGPEFSTCEREYARERCEHGTWVGGIGPAASIERDNPMKLLCCSYPKLSASIQSGHVEVRAGQVLQGGEVLDRAEGREVAFEYIANLQRLFDRQGIVYVAEVRKFACQQPGEEGGMMIRTTFDEGTGQEQGQGEEAAEADELRIVPNGQKKEDEQKVLAEFSEYEDGLQKEAANAVQDQQQKPADLPSYVQKFVPKIHIHVGKVGPKEQAVGQSEMKPAAIGQSIGEVQEDRGGKQDDAELLQFEPSKPDVFAPQQWKQAAGNVPEQLQVQPASFHQPSLHQLSPSPFGGYEMGSQNQPRTAQHWPQPLAPANGLLLQQPVQLLNPSPLPFGIPPLQGPQQPRGHSLIKIPTPEEIEQAIPPHGKLLLSKLARTFLGLHRLF